MENLEQPRMAKEIPKPDERKTMMEMMQITAVAALDKNNQKQEGVWKKQH